MSAYAVALVKVKNPEKMQEYAKKAEPTLGIYGGKVKAKGSVQGALCGTTNLNVVAVMEFESIEKIDEWYESDEYQAIIATRDEGADMTILKLQVPS